ncbi:LysR family transcriptional regulator [Acidovorax sp. LjRoot129]|uniref:LysR family transcriptional regulator n=1 Tax=Acidovorax sp. LjRoot129 TaxID=3342260 RepID=UPI003ED0050A
MIQLRHLRYFIVVAEELSFRRASERLHVDQTPLSRAMRDLEDRLGVEVLIRTPRRLQLTPAGDRLFGEARELLMQVERSIRVVRETDARVRAPLRIGISDDLSQPRLARCLSSWRNAVPEVPLEVTELRASEFARALRNEEVDAGFSFGLPEDTSITQDIAWKYSAVAVLPIGHELAGQPALSISELFTFPFLAYRTDRQPGLAHQLQALVRPDVEMPSLKGHACTFAGYLTRVAAGFGVGIADVGHAAMLSRADVVVLPLREPMHISTFVAHKSTRIGSSVALRRFIAHARTQE